jgi:hypothetical protein
LAGTRKRSPKKTARKKSTARRRPDSTVEIDLEKIGLPGRPTKISADMIEQIVRLLENGNYIETVCDFVGITKPTFYDWRRRGQDELDRVQKAQGSKLRVRKAEAPFVEFFLRTKRAAAQADVVDLTRIAMAGNDPKFWTARAWRLERRNPGKYGRAERPPIEREGMKPAITDLLDEMRRQNSNGA